MTPAPQQVIKAVIFDLGNVLIAVDETRALDRMATRAGKTRRELEGYVMLTPFVNQLARGELSSEQFFEIMRRDTSGRNSEVERLSAPQMGGCGVRQNTSWPSEFW